MDITKKLKQKHKKLARNKRIKNILYKSLTPLIKLDEFIYKKKENKRRQLGELGRNMTIYEARDIAVNLIVERLIKHERNIALIVAEYADYEYDCFTTIRWILDQIRFNNKNKKYEMLKSYIYKNESYGEKSIEFNRKFTEAIYEKIKDIPNIKAEWVIDKEQYGYWKSRNYEKTLIVGLEGVNNDKETN